LDRMDDGHASGGGGGSGGSESKLGGLKWYVTATFIERWKYIFEHNRMTIIDIIVVTLSMIIASREAWNLALTLLEYFFGAHAEGLEKAALPAASSNIDFIAVIFWVLNMYFVWALGMISFGRNVAKVKFAFESVKTVSSFYIGLVVGTFRGARV
jgi:hypothetical protein